MELRSLSAWLSDDTNAGRSCRSVIHVGDNFSSRGLSRPQNEEEASRTVATIGHYHQHRRQGIVSGQHQKHQRRRQLIVLEGGRYYSHNIRIGIFQHLLLVGHRLSHELDESRVLDTLHGGCISTQSRIIQFFHPTPTTI